MTEQIALINGIDICYDTIGDPAAEPLLLIMGLGAPLIWWEDEFCALLVNRGFFVIRYDNRDCGRSQRMTGRGSPARALLRLPGPYTLAEMADDAAGLLDHLGIPSAHVAGVSLGGMIGQALAIDRPERVRSLVSMMSSTGSRRVGYGRLSVVRLLTERVPNDRDSYVAAMLRISRAIGSPGFPFDEARIAARAGRTFDRGVNPAGTRRQLAAAMSAPDRTRSLRRLRVPAEVIHGAADPLIHCSGGIATARAIPDAKLWLVKGMGHDLPPPLWPAIADVLRRTADRAPGS
ncbi:MAG TPA: alpha/beta fold hydrolase [Pseudonocardiaceae bacterium]|jgi:pimeloyl-ACP methyl ester carboxylesterase